MPRVMDLRRIDLNLLHIFDAIYRCSSISQAAEQLGMNQPTVSNALNRLRQQLDDPLFYRSDRGVAPTAYAKTLVAPVRQALSVLTASLTSAESFDPATAQRHFRIATAPFVTPVLVPAVLRRIDVPDGGVRLEILFETVTPLVDALINDEIDLAVDVLPYQADELTFEPIAQTQIVCIARRGHPFIDGHLTREDYSRAGHVVLPQPMRVQTLVEGLLLENRIQRRIVCIARSSTDLPALVSQTDLIAMVPRRLANSVAAGFNLQTLDLPFTYPPQPIFVGHRTNRANDSGLNWLKSTLIEALKDD